LAIPRRPDRKTETIVGVHIVAQGVNQARIRIIGPTAAGGYIVEFDKHTGQRLCFMVPPNASNDFLDYFQARMPYGVAVPDLDAQDTPERTSRSNGRGSVT
jgi:hypothetical protein